MKQKILFIAMITALFCACENRTSTKPIAMFELKVQQPMKVVLTNESSYATRYRWDFGDGSTSTESNPVHKYDKIGVYRIKLTAYNDDAYSDECEANATIEAPTKCIFTGFSVTKIPNENCYYQLQLTDDYSLMKSTYTWTDWFLLSSANIPYTYNFSSPVLLDTSKKYVNRIYVSSTKPSGQASGKGNYQATLTPADLKSYPESITYTWKEHNIGLEVNFLWK